MVWLFAGLQVKVDANFAADLQNDVLALDGLEALGLGADLIIAGKQVGSVVLARMIRGQRFAEVPRSTSVMVTVAPAIAPPFDR